ncbi:DUF6295 family protein [Tepidiforma sp.]|uniref:DUF6295 family protein n=1 Tax=Tepidiforma sp. TaxID=2682230 RepID=UPI002ADE08DF|nr:DUF6295 family protein [Tepidiforma sp.]
MCTNILVGRDVEGAGFGRNGWFPVTRVSVTYDHPLYVDMEHAVTVDFVDASGPLDARVGVELTVESARALAEALLAACAEAEAYEAGRTSPTASGGGG